VRFSLLPRLFEFIMFEGQWQVYKAGDGLTWRMDVGTIICRIRFDKEWTANISLMDRCYDGGLSQGCISFYTFHDRTRAVLARSCLRFMMDFVRREPHL
jgi:hypothetical protein